jgi:hypothetical protein
MRRSRVVLVAMLVALTVGGLALAGSQQTFSVHASGDLEVPVRDTRAQGQAIFHLSEGGEALSYKLIVANIENVIMAHIHMAPPGMNGDIVVWLFPSTTSTMPAPAGGGRLTGPIAQGTITADNLVGPLSGQSLSDLVEALRDGNAYVNVHTDDGVAPQNTGPGDFFPGEIRGNF